MPLGHYNEPPRLSPEEQAGIAGAMYGERTRARNAAANMQLPLEDMAKGNIADEDIEKLAAAPSAEEEPEQPEEETAPALSGTTANAKQAREMLASLRTRVAELETQEKPLNKIIKILQMRNLSLRAKQYTTDQWMDIWRTLATLWGWVMTASATIFLAIFALPAGVAATIAILIGGLIGILLPIYARTPLSQTFLTEQKIKTNVRALKNLAERQKPLEREKKKLYQQINLIAG